MGVRAILANFFANTFGVEKLVTIILMSGLILALVWSLHYVKKNNITDSIERAQTVLISMFLSAFAFLAIGININYLFSFDKNPTREVKILKIEAFIKTRGIMKGEKFTPSGYHVTIEKEGKIERVRYQTLSDYQSYIGQTKNLNIRTGLLGFEVFIPNPLNE
jgi:hypothetical protein